MLERFHWLLCGSGFGRRLFCGLRGSGERAGRVWVVGVV